MPSANITALTNLATMQPSMLMYAGLSPFGVTDDRKITASALLTTISPLSAGVQAVTVTAAAVPTVPTVSFNHAANNSRIQFDPSNAGNITDTFDMLSVYSEAAQPASIGAWNASATGISQWFLYAGATGFDFLRGICVGPGNANTTLLDVPNSGVLMTSNTTSGGMFLVADVAAPIIFATGGHAFSNEKGRFDAAGLTLGHVSTITGALNLANAASANLTTITAGNAAAARTYVWPTNFGGAGTVLTDAAGNGTLSWAAGGGSGNTTSQGTFAARPAAGTAGNLYFSTDGFSISRDTGAAYSQWGPIYLLTAPVLTDFSAFNQGSATATQSDGAIFTVCPPSASHSLRIWERNVPGGAYTVTMAFQTALPKLNSYFVGMCLRDSVGLGVITFNISTGASGTGNPQLIEFKWTDATTPSAAYTSIDFDNFPAFIFLRIVDDTTNRIVSYSWDGINFIQFASQLRTDFITPDKIGFFTDTENAGLGVAMTVYSWNQ